MPIEYDRADILNWIEWDTFIAKPNMYQDPTVTLFNKPFHFPDNTHLRTSLVMSNVLPSPEHFNVTSLQIAFGDFNDPKDMQLFKTYTRYELWLGSKIYDQGPFSRFLIWNDKIDYELLVKAKDMGLKFVSNEVEYRIGESLIGHHILQGQFFQFCLHWDEILFNPVKEFRMVVFLKGVKSRAVQ